jgi:hypothetical protein
MILDAIAPVSSLRATSSAYAIARSYISIALPVSPRNRAACPSVFNAVATHHPCGCPFANSNAFARPTKISSHRVALSIASSTRNRVNAANARAPDKAKNREPSEPSEPLRVKAFAIPPSIASHETSLERRLDAISAHNAALDAASASLSALFLALSHASDAPTTSPRSRVKCARALANLELASPDPDPAPPLRATMESPCSSTPLDSSRAPSRHRDAAYSSISRAVPIVVTDASSSS